MSIGAIDSQALLEQMRAFANEARGTEIKRSAEVSGTDFGQVLKQALDAVNANQTEAGRMTQSFERGDPGMDLAEVMVAIQKANVSFQAATQVRNRLVAAYQDIMNMPI
ncbi:MAG: flagellar hook-basal body complex protein FliE [Proteobacteria bacterium]|nr:flagellar hook-basal body complex protein FliE [Pseudomonadota bacterium]